MSPFHSPGARAALVCLDLQRGREAQAGPAILAACRRGLTEARRRSWPVLHVHDRRLADPRPIAGLEPRPDEPVFQRRGPSAFSNPNFARAALALGGPIALIGINLEDTVLATAFACADRGLEVEVCLDAIAAGDHDPHAVARVLLSPLRALAPHVRLVEIDRLLTEDAGRFAAANLP